MARPHSRRFLPASHPLAIALGLLAAAACAPAGDANGEMSAGTSAAPQSQTPQPDFVRPGIEVLLTDSLSLVRGRRAGLITNHTGRDRSGTPSIDLLADHPEVELVALFSPEHGIRGSAEAGVRVESGVDERTGLPIHSLYGEIRAPTPEMLDGIEVLLFDIQDIGTRYYTYLSTMALAMEAAGAHGIPFVVLDRPNPIGGDPVHGNILDPAFSSFVGLYPIPMRHGLTAGEFARMAVRRVRRAGRPQRRGPGRLEPHDALRGTPASPGSRRRPTCRRWRARCTTRAPASSRGRRFRWDGGRTSPFSRWARRGSMARRWRRV